jgi:hypothetical protein
MTIIAAIGMTDFVREVRARCDGAIDPAEMGRFLATNRIEAASLDGFVRFAPGRYTRHLVHKDRDVEILVLCWARDRRRRSTGTRASTAGPGSSAGGSRSRATARRRGRPCGSSRSGPPWRPGRDTSTGPPTSTP